jgi:restriction endonuclease BglII
VRVKISRGATSDLRRSLLAALRADGWSREVHIAPGSSERITSMRGKVGLCVQTGNTAALFRDLFKLLYLHSKKELTGGILIVPTAASASLLGTNYSSMEHLVSTLKLYDQVIPVPIEVIGFSSEE